MVCACAQNRGNVMLFGGKFPNAPVARSFGHVGINEFLAANFAQIAVTPHEQNPWNGLPFCQAGQELVRRDSSHQKFSKTSDTRREAKSRDIRSSAGPCSSKNFAGSVEIS